MKKLFIIGLVFSVIIIFYKKTILSEQPLLLAMGSSPSSGPIGQANVDAQAVNRLPSRVQSQIGKHLFKDHPLKKLLMQHAAKVISISRYDAINAIAFDPQDSNRIALGASNGMIYIWNITGNNSELSWKAHDSRVDALAFRPDSQQVVSGSKDGEITLYDIVPSEMLLTFTAHEFDVTTLAYNPQNPSQLASGSNDRKIIIWDTATQARIATLQARSYVNSVAFIHRMEISLQNQHRMVHISGIFRVGHFNSLHYQA